MAQLQDFKCPACGGAVEFNSRVQKMKCPFCDSEFDMSAVAQDAEADANMEPSTMDWSETAGEQWTEGETANMKVYTCQSCSGQIVTDDVAAASSCPYCGNQVVMTGQFQGDLKPDFIIPFKFDKEQAKDMFRKFVKDRKYVPLEFRTQKHIDEIKGMYAPFWVFDASVRANIKYKATRSRHWSDSDYNYTETSYYGIHRGGTIAYEKVPVDGSSKLADDLMESIEPFNFGEAVPFQTAYMAGYLADRYDVDEVTSEARANERVKTSTEDAFRNTVNGYETVMVENSSMQLLDGRVKYVMYPVWLLSKTYKDKVYTFAMNGQTGRFVGDLPVDKKALTKFFLISSVIASAIAFLAVYLYFMFIA